MSPPHTVQASNNTVVLEVDNLLVGWPAYVINYTPSHPGPIKSILRLKDVSPYVWVEEEDSDSDESSTQQPAVVVPNNTRTTTNVVKSLTVDALPEMTGMSTSNIPICVPVDATPVELHGLLKELTRKNLKRDHFINNNIPWPPPRPRAFREVDKKAATTHFKTLKALPRSVKDVGKENKA
ncbi:hypothetical protein PAXRUDRAFT_152873 [Paxillus rubicundulus Ve08.2h10]|uniref:Uncharacterized protein n=1 Tax=Paxillus rubicundulus Ve08.2h10 TaxID=930991 RepID=A0A0D0D757_9AGAM|nr:hypothetical protein PAXRUDRAFT_152873 [Paxillus rubicundulus Ve08.2h10]